MADEEQFSLCWNNFNSNLSAGFHESLCRGDLVDVTLAAEGQLVKAHRLVLSVCSPYFRKMFIQMPSNQHAFVFLKDVSHAALKDLIQFMYCGEVNVKQDALPAFISTAEALQIKGLTESGETTTGGTNNSNTTTTTTTAPTPSSKQGKSSQQIIGGSQSVSSPAAAASGSAATTTTINNTIQPSQRSRVVRPINRSTTTTTTTPQQQQSATSYKLESESETEEKHTQPIQQQQQQQLHVLSQKRAQIRGSTSQIKRMKTINDPLEAHEQQQHTIKSTASQHHHQQHQQHQQHVSIVTTGAQSIASDKSTTGEPEFIDLPIEPTKTEPEYADDDDMETTHDDDDDVVGILQGGGDDGGDQSEHEATGYVEDDSYGEMKYDESYFTENEDTKVGGGVGGSGTVGHHDSATAAATAAGILSETYGDGEQSLSEAQDSAASAASVILINKLSMARNKKKVKKGKKSSTTATKETATKLKETKSSKSKSKSKYDTVIRDGEKQQRRRRHHRRDIDRMTEINSKDSIEEYTIVKNIHDDDDNDNDDLVVDDLVVDDDDGGDGGNTLVEVIDHHDDQLIECERPDKEFDKNQNKNKNKNKNLKKFNHKSIIICEKKDDLLKSATTEEGSGKTTTTTTTSTVISGNQLGVIKLDSETFVLFQNKTNILHYEGYQFKIEKHRGQRTYYHCCELRTKSCKARLVMLNENDDIKKIFSYKEHNHPKVMAIDDDEIIGGSVIDGIDGIDGDDDGLVSSALIEGTSGIITTTTTIAAGGGDGAGGAGGIGGLGRGTMRSVASAAATTTGYNTIIHKHQQHRPPTTKLLHKNCMFYKHYTLTDRTYWRCHRSNFEQRCSARLCTHSNGVYEISSHNHPVLN